MLLPQNDEVANLRALNTFMEGLAELGINKNLIKNKKLLSDPLEKEKSYRNEEEESDNGADDSNSTDSNEEEASGEGVELRNLKRAKMTLAATAMNQQKAILKTRTLFSLKFPVNIVRDLTYTKQRFCDAPNARGTIPP